MLRYLDFDYTEDTHGVGVFEAMASVPSAQVRVLHAEVAVVLAWAHQTYPDQQAPLDDGGEWDFNLDGMQELSAVETLTFDADTQCIGVRLGPVGPPRHNMTLSVTGSAEFCAAFQKQFALA